MSKLIVLYWGPVNDLSHKNIDIEGIHNIKVIPYPFVEGVRGDYVLIVGLKKIKRCKR